MITQTPKIRFRIISKITYIFNRLASIILFFMMFLTIGDVLLRKILNKSILGTVELSEFMMVIIVFFSLSWTELLDSHIKVDLVMKHLGKGIQTSTEIFTQLICSIFFGFATFSTLIYCFSMKISKEVSQDLWIPKYPFILLAAIGFGLLSIVLFIKFLIALKK